MIRLAVSVEGQTEEEFIKLVLAKHLQAHDVWVQPILIGRARGPGVGGGNVTVNRLSSEMAYLRSSFDAVTSLVDFYGFKDKGDRSVEQLELAVQGAAEDRIGGQDERVAPYVQVHEFEGLLFSNVEAFALLPEVVPRAVGALAEIRSRFESPEDINDNQLTSPSHRIQGEISAYRKRAHGPLIAEEITLEVIRSECPRFDNWVRRLEGMGAG